MSAIGTPDVAAYLAALERELADLATDERDDLLEEVEASLLEIEEDPIARLGPPARFAAELRASAGLPPAPEPPAEPVKRRSLRERLATSPTVHAAAGLAHELAPIWWAIRAYIAVIALAALFAAPVTTVLLIPRFSSAETGAAILILALIASVAIGIAARRRMLPLRPVWIALDVALAAITIVLLANEFNSRVIDSYPTELDAPPAGVVNRGVPVNNIFVYDADGKLLHDVRLYDSYGQALDIRPADPDASRRVLKTRGGMKTFNTFPIRFFEPGTHRVDDPDAAPPGLKPPPLRSRNSPSP